MNTLIAILLLGAGSFTARVGHVSIPDAEGVMAQLPRWIMRYALYCTSWILWLIAAWILGIQLTM